MRRRLFLLCLMIGLLVAPLNAADSADNDRLGAMFQSIEEMSPRRYESFSTAQRTFLYNDLARNEVATVSRLGTYDPDGILGFCFGRAMAAHLIAMRMGLRPEGLRKLFIVGELKTGTGTGWRFHVTTLVKGDDSQWYCMDTTEGMKLETVKNYIDRLRERWDRGKKARLYITDVSAVLPDVRTVPDVAEERGTSIIELSFNPARVEGFTPDSSMGEELYEIDGERTRRYFICTGEPDGFDFQKIVINGKTYEYRGYFRDLLRSLRNAPQEAFDL